MHNVLTLLDVMEMNTMHYEISLASIPRPFTLHLVHQAHC